MKQRSTPYDRDVALTAAMNLFWKKGYHATSLKDLEGALEMKPGSIYAAFQSKENLFSLTLDRYFDDNRAGFVRMIGTHASPLAGLVAFMRQTGRIEGDDPKYRACMLVKTMLNATDEDQAMRDKACGYLVEMEQAMGHAFQRAMDAGELADDVDVGRLARRYQSSVTALKVEGYRGGDPVALAQLADDMADGFAAMRVGGSLPA